MLAWLLRRLLAGLLGRILTWLSLVWLLAGLRLILRLLILRLLLWLTPAHFFRESAHRIRHIALGIARPFLLFPPLGPLRIAR